jgi:exopolyphosphatase/guanosine-5'-triphosphate,3'-diphosphate pyrophosphatase
MPGAVPEILAAVDLGSNSFHMVVARYRHGQLTIVDRLREMVRLAAGLDDHGRLSRESVQGALQCLERFGQRLRDMRADSVRVVGTNTLRKARRRGAFVERARDALGHPIEIISGVEEARLIYLGVAHTTPSGTGQRLVVDIGGGKHRAHHRRSTDREAAREFVHGLRESHDAVLSPTVKSPRSA